MPEARHSGPATGAFYAMLSSDAMNLGSGQSILFDAVVYNTGEYNPATGIFACSVSGVYVFTMVACSRDADMNTQMELRVNGVVMGYANSGNGSGYTMGSKTIVTRCEALQDVHAVCSFTGNSFRGSGHSAFSGFLLHPDQ